MSGEDYDEWRLADARGALLSDHDIRFFRDMLPEVQPGERVLEIGAGTGRFTVPALEQGISLIATDINESLLSSLKRKIAELGFADRCEIQEDNIFGLSFPDAEFDLVFSLHVIPRFLNRRFTDTVCPGGQLSEIMRQCA